MDVEQVLANEALPKFGLLPLGNTWKEFDDAGKELVHPAFEQDGLSEWLNRVQEALSSLGDSGRWKPNLRPGLAALHPYAVAGAIRYRYSKRGADGGYTLDDRKLLRVGRIRMKLRRLFLNVLGEKVAEVREEADVWLPALSDAVREAMVHEDIQDWPFDRTVEVAFIGAFFGALIKHHPRSNSYKVKKRGHEAIARDAAVRALKHLGDQKIWTIPAGQGGPRNPSKELLTTLIRRASLFAAMLQTHVFSKLLERIHGATAGRMTPRAQAMYFFLSRATPETGKQCPYRSVFWDEFLHTRPCRVVLRRALDRAAAMSSDPAVVYKQLWQDPDFVVMVHAYCRAWQEIQTPNRVGIHRVANSAVIACAAADSDPETRMVARDDARDTEADIRTKSVTVLTDIAAQLKLKQIRLDEALGILWALPRDLRETLVSKQFESEPERHRRMRAVLVDNENMDLSHIAAGLDVKANAFYESIRTGIQHLAAGAAGRQGPRRGRKPHPLGHPISK